MRIGTDLLGYWQNLRVVVDNCCPAGSAAIDHTTVAVCEHPFACAILGVMLSEHEIEGMRRSNVMGGLSRDVVAELLDCAVQMARERRQIAELLNGLPTSITAVREALNALQRIIG